MYDQFQWDMQRQLNGSGLRKVILKLKLRHLYILVAHEQALRNETMLSLTSGGQ